MRVQLSGKRLRRRFWLARDIRLVIGPRIVGRMNERDQGRHDRDRSQDATAARARLRLRRLLL